MKHHNNHLIRQILTVLLQAVIVLIGIATLGIMLLEPRFADQKDWSLFQVYTNDSLLSYICVGSIPFFVALYQGIRVLGYIRQNKTYSQAVVNALRTIKYCAFIAAGAIAVAAVYIKLAAISSGDDSPGPDILGILATFAVVVTGIVTATFQRLLQNAVNTKSKKDRTV